MALSSWTCARLLRMVP